MAIVASIHVPFEEVTHEKKDEAFQTILDDIINAYATLIADVEDKRIPLDYLKSEIEKKITTYKHIYNPSLMYSKIVDAIYGYGPLEAYIKDLDVSDIHGSRYDHFVVKRKGRIEKVHVAFESESEFEQYCKVIVIRHGGMINLRDTHCRVSDRGNKLRINVCIPPRNTTGTSIHIRKHVGEAYTFIMLMQRDYFDFEACHIVKELNESGKSIVIAGKGGSGKTTLLRTLVENGNNLERMLVCEVDSEIYPQNKNAIAQQTAKKNQMNDGNTLDDIVREGLTMSLDTYCIGKITGAEAWSFIKAGHTGHRIMTTLHANSAEDALYRLLMLTENETQIEVQTLKAIISSSIDAIIFIDNFKVQEIVEVNTFDTFSLLYRKGKAVCQ